jgi:hypothetical protein
MQIGPMQIGLLQLGWMQLRLPLTNRVRLQEASQ